MKRKTLLNISLIAMLAVSMLAILGPTPVSAGVSPYSPADAISMVPSQKIYETDVECQYNETSFKVNITITNITDCAGYMFKIDYNNTLLKATSVNFGTDPANPMSPTQMAPALADRTDTIKSLTPSIQVSTFWMSWVPTYNYTGESVAAEITFNGTMRGISTLSFDQDWTRATDYWGEDILFAKFNDGVVEVIPEFPAAIIMSLLLTATLAAAFLGKMVWSRKRKDALTAE